MATATPPPPEARLHDLYQTLGSDQFSPTVREHLWQTWLWSLDCNADPRPACGDLNAAHTVGLFLAILESHHPGGKDEESVATMLPTVPLVHLSPGPVSRYRLRELADQLQCLQLNWAQVLSLAEPEDAERALMALMRRFGTLARHAFPNREPAGVLDDPQHVTPLPVPEQPGGLLILSRKFIRQTSCVLLALFRVLHIVRNAEVAPELAEAERADALSAFKIHHVEASMDLFFFLQQMARLAPGMRLVYRADFAGMYNDISQVVYFHYPQYSRQPQRELQAIALSGIHSLPLASQLMPDVPVAYDDDSVIPGLTGGELQYVPEPTLVGVVGGSTSKTVKRARFTWLVACGTVFLVEVETRRILASPDEGILPLIHYVARATGRSLTQAKKADDAEARGRLLRAGDDGTAAPPLQTLPPHGHVVLL